MKGKFTFKKLVLTGVAIVFILSLVAPSVVYNVFNAKTTEDKATKSTVKTISIKLYKNDGTAVVKNDVGITNPIIQTSDQDFALSGEEILKKATAYLGRNYDAAQAAYQPNNGKLDCSGLVRVALRELGASTDGFYERGNDADLPRSVMNWIQYRPDDSYTYYFHEVGTYGIDGNTISFAAADKYVTDRESVYSRAETLKIVKGNSSNGINVLKVNNPINDQLRWYNYYDANGNLTDLPMGTIVCAYGGSPYKNTNWYVGPDHMWICIGNLGTANATEAANKLVEMGIITEAQRQYVKSESSTSKYWLIESSPKTGRDGVYICNWDPDLNSSTGKKGVGAIWAYQVARGAKTGSFTMDVAKVDKNDTSKKLSGAKYNFQDRNYSPTHIYTDSAVDSTKYNKKGGAITTGSNGTAQLPVGGASNAYTKTIDKTGNYVYNYSIQEVKAPDGYSINDKNQHFGYKVCTKLINNQYQVVSVDIFYGSWDKRVEGENWFWVNTTQRPTIWYTTAGRFVSTDPEAANTVAKFTLSGSGANVKLTTTYYNEKIKGDYNLNIVKKPEGETYDDDTNRKYSTAMAGAKFEVKQYLNNNSVDNLPANPDSYGRSSGQNTDVVVTDSGNRTPILLKQRDENNNVIQVDGHDKYDKNVNIFKTNLTDIYTINETEAPEGTYNDWNRGPVKLIVYKKAVNGKYLIEKIKLQTGDKGYEATIPESGTAWIRVDKSGNKTVDKNEYAIAVEASTGTINITWRNPFEVDGKYNINVKKIDAKTKRAIPSVEFKVNNVARTTDSNGIAQYDDVTVNRNNVNTIDLYTVEETSLGAANADKYYKLNETISFEVKKEYNTTTKKYNITGIRFAGETEFKKSISKNVKDVSNRDIPITIEVDDNTNTITLTAENNGVAPGKFYLTKTDTNGSTNLDETSFKVDKYIVDNYENMNLGTPSTILNGKLSTISNRLIDDVNPMVPYPGAYVYDIHETTAQTGYLNLFKRIENGQETELAYIRLVIRCDENDNLVATHEIIRTSACTDDEYEEIIAVVNKPTINQTNRSVTLNIKNPGTTILLNLKKYLYNNSKLLLGGTYKVELDGSVVNSNELNITGNQSITIPNIAVGDHSIRVYELNPPTGYDNVFDQFANVDGIRVDFTVNNDGSKTIKTVTKDGRTYSFTPESQNHVANTQEIEAISEYVGAYMLAPSSNTITVYIKDPTHFEFEMFKKQYTGKDDISQEDKFAGTANFTIKEVTPKTSDKFNGTLPTNTQSHFFTEENVKAGTTYTYEVTETDVSSGYYRNLVGKKIKVIVVTDANGRIDTTRTKYEIYDENGNLVTGNAKKDLDTFIKLEVSTSNKVNLYVANMPTVGYRVRICKVDEDGNAYKRTAIFNSVMSTTASTDTKTRTDITTNPNTGIANITEGTEIVERGATHTYTINETKAPAGCVLLDGTVKLNVTFNNNTTGNVIQSANVKYYNASGTETILDGLDVTYNQGGTSAPLVTVYVPNEGRDFEFEVKKVDSMGNLIKATTDSEGNYDGVGFTIERSRLDKNPDVTIPADEAEEFAKMINEISAELSNGERFSGILEDGTYTDKIPLGENLIYSYIIRETSAKKGYANDLQDKQIMLYIYTKKDSNNKPYIDRVSFRIIDTMDHGVDVTERYRSYVEPVISSDKTKVDLKITNPNGYKIRLNKTDLSGNPIDSSKIEAYKVNPSSGDELIVKLNEIDTSAGTISLHDSSVTSDYVGIGKNEEQVFKIYEKTVGYPYYNVFGQDKYVEVKVKMNNNGILSVTGYTVKDNQGREYTDLKQYVDQIDIITENGDTIVNVTFKNPSGYKLRITKYNGDGTTELTGAVVKLDGAEVISNGSSHYENDYMAGVSSTRIFTITEQSTVANHTNVLAGKEIQLKVSTDSKGNISRSYKIMSGSREIFPPDKVYDYVSVGDVQIGNNGEAFIDVKIVNPLVGKYNVELYKADENGNLIKNYNATFGGIRTNGKMNFKPINFTTSNGVANVDSDVLINDVYDSYHYQLTEYQAPLGYERLASIIALDTFFKDTGDKLTLDETRTKLQVGSRVIPMSDRDGQYVGDNTEAWFIDNSGNTTTIKIYIKNEKKKFDLALRKYIAKVENAYKSESPNPYRSPELNIFSLSNWRSTHTAAYFHTKEAYKVEVGDIVTYRIYVYNEGNVKGYASEITDYLESGLDYIDNEFNREYGWVAEKNPDGTTTVTTRHLQTTLLNEIGLQDFVLGKLNTPKWFDYVEIQCKVTRPASDVISYVTDRAEITEDRAVNVDSQGYITTLDLDDIDSQPENVKQYHEKEMFNYDPEPAEPYSNESYYPGFQDDDDKETVYVEKHGYDFIISKTDGDEEISGAQFKIEEMMDDGEYEEIYTGSINKNKTIHEPEARGDSSVEFFKTYTYKITETATKDSNYNNLLDGKYIIVKTYMDDEEYLHKGENDRGSYSNYFTAYGFAIYNSSDDSLISDTDDVDGDLYNNIAIDIYNRENPPQIKVTIPNERLYFGNYKINLKKTDTSNKNMEGIPFYINGHRIETNTQGVVPVSEFHQGAEADGTVNIDKYNVDMQDIYTIEEENPIFVDDEHVDEEMNPTYVAILNEVKLTLTKSLDTVNEKYYVSNVHVDYNSSDELDIPLSSANDSATRTINLDLLDRTTVPATISVAPNGSITITAKNEYITGDYKLRLHKVDENNAPVPGIEFGVTGESSNMVTGNDGYTRTITKNITADNLNTVDEYTITEYQDSTGKVVRIKSPIKISVKKKNTYTKYTIDKIKLTEVNTGRESAESTVRTELSNCAIDDDSGRTVTVQAIVDANGLITISFENPPVEDIINVKIKKVNSKDNSGINGITFGTRINQSSENRVTTANVNGEDGIAYIDQNRKVTSATSFTYEIRERAIPSTPEGLIFLSDVGWLVTIRTKYDESIGHYVIDKDRISVRVNTYPGDATIEQREKQEEIANRIKASLSEDNATLTLNIENEQVTRYGLSIRKADMDTNEEIAGAKFTVKEDGRVIAENQTITEFASRIVNKTGVYVNTTHRYEIYETSPASEYKNILEKTYIELVITLGADGAATATYDIKAQPGGTSSDVQNVKTKIQEYVNAHASISAFLEKNGNDFKLNIPNPKDTIPVSADLIKFETGDINKKVNNAKFNVRKTTFDNATTGTIDAAVNRFDNDASVEDLTPITTRSNATNWVERNFVATFGKVYYYELTETDVPTNYKEEFHSAIVKMYLEKVNDENVVRASIVKVKETETSSWTDYDGTNFADRLSVEVSGTTVHVKWANELSYKFRLWKKSYNAVIPQGGPSAIPDPAGGANFKITSSNNNTTLVDGLIHQTELYTEEDIHSNTTYTYVLNENDPPSGHYNLFKDMDIVVKVHVGANGILSPNNSTIEVRASAGKTVSDEILAEARHNVDLIVDVENNTADVYIANKQIHNTYDIKIMKVSDKKEIDPITGEERYKGIPDIGFSVLNSSLAPIGSGTTGSDGTLTISGIEPNGFTNNFAIAEDTTSARNAGITPLYGWIQLVADMTGISPSMTEEEIEEYLNEKNPDGTPKRFSLQFLDSRDSANGATVQIEGRTVIIMIKNRTTDLIFNLSKVDPIGTRIAGEQIGNEYISGADFRIVNSKANPDQELWDGELIIGGYTQYTHAQTNTWYEYTIREKATKVGHINVTQGYDIQVHLQTDAQGVVLNPNDDNRTFISLIPNGLEEPIYSTAEILNNNWVRLGVNYRTETDEDTGDQITVASEVTLYVVNPYEYKLQLNKKDKNGSTPLSVATVTAENIIGADVSKIYNQGTLDERAFVLTQIAHAGTTGTVHVNGDPVTLDKEPTTTSDEYLVDLQGRYAQFDNNQTWRITETDVDSPYKNILEDKYVIINTYYNGELLLAKHTDITLSQLVDFYVIDKDGQDLTADYINYIEVSVEQINGQWTAIVTIKDPSVVRMGLYKKVDSLVDEPLQGANLTLQLGSQTAAISDGAYRSEMLEAEVPIGSAVIATITETSTTKGHTNILRGKTLRYPIQNIDGEYVADRPFIMEGPNTITGDEYDYIMSHVELRKKVNDDGFTEFMLYIENPTSFIFDLTKLDIDGNNLNGTKIKVISSHSGEHVLDGQSNMNFIEEDVSEHEIIQYTITEIQTANGAYVNKFDNKIYITATVEGGEVKIVEKKHEVELPNGSKPIYPFDELEYFDIYVDPADKEDLADGEMQTLTIKMENPPEIEVNLLKTQAGSANTTPIRNTKFTIASVDNHTEYTNAQGIINYLEEIHETGDYTIRVYEDEVPDANYVNILENRYMQFDISVAADGTVTLKNNGEIRFFEKDNDTYYDNDVEITGDEATKLAEYCSVSVSGNSVSVHIEDPVKFDLGVIKVATDGADLEGAEFEITSVEGLNDTIRKETDENGKIEETISWVNPGVYEYHITEIKAANEKFDNVLLGNMIVAYVKIAGNGELTLVSDHNGTPFTNNVLSTQRYIVKKLDGTAASAEDEARIRKFCTIRQYNLYNSPDGFELTVINPIQTKLDIVKRQYNIEGQEEVLTDTRFTVVKNGSNMLLNNQIVNEEIEIEEHDLTDGDDYYDIYENSTNTNGAYVNILNGKFIRVYTQLRATGTLRITDEEGNVGDTFDIYETQHYGAARKVAREGNEELYDSVSVWVSQNADGINVLNVKVINPITIDVGVIKKQYGEGAEPIPDVSITITSDNTGDHNITSTRSEEVFSEGNIKPGTYNFIIRENSNPNPRYVNVLKDRYAKANVTISKTGDITLNNIKYYTNNNVEIVDPEVKAILEETVYARIDKSNRIQKITFVIENPVTLKFLVHKVDLADNGLEGATFNVVKYVGDSDEVAKGMTSVDTDNDGVITFEDGDYMKAGIYRYEITELKPAAEKYVNILDCYDDGSQYKVVMYLKLNLDGTTEYVKDAQGTSFAIAERIPYTIVNRNNSAAAIPDEVTEIVHKYLSVNKTDSRGNNPDIYEVEVTNTPQIDIDVIKVTKENGVEKSLSGTKFSAEADDGKRLFEDIPATQDKEHTYKNVSAGRHEFYLTESEGVVNGGYINVLEDRYVRVYTTIDADGVMKITDRLGNENAGYFEIYDGQYNNRSGSALLDRTEYAKIYDCVSVESVRQANGVYKLNLKVTNPERNYNIKLNKKVFGEEDINMKNVQFFIRSSVDNQGHQLTTDENGNISFEEKRVPVGTYTYYVTETNTSGPEFVNILENNYIAVALKVNQDGSIEIVDISGRTEEGRYYILDARCTQIIDPNTTIVDDFVRVATDNSGDEPELNFFIKDPEKFNFKLVKRDDLTNENLNNVTFTSKVYYQEASAGSDPTDADMVELVNAETFENIDISTIKTANIDGVDGVVMVPNILVDKTGTYTFVFHEESTDGLFKYLYKSHAEDITLKVNITVETDNQGRPIGYKVGQPIIVTGAKYIDDESTLTTPTKAQTVRAEVLNTPIRGHYNLVLSKLDKYTSRKLDGAEFDIRAEKDGVAYELYEDVDDLRIENAIIPNHVTVQNGEIVIENIRITPPPYQAPEPDGTLETFNIILTETKAPAGYMLLDDPIVLEVTTAIDGEYDDAEYVVKSVNLISGDNHGLVTKTFGKNEINVVAKDEYFDLALRKSIVSVAYSDSEDSKITEEETEDRIPVIYEDDEIYDLNPSVTTANYRHVKNHVRVYPGQEVIYCLRVYNEGEIDGYAEEITDHLPEGLEFLATDKFNTDRGWTYDLNDQTLRTVKTTFLSKENNPNNDRFNAENNLIKAMDTNVATGVEHELDFKEIEIKCRVSDNLRPGVILTNIAEITEYKAEGRTAETVDRDSVADNADVPDGKDLQNYKEDELTDDRTDYVPGQEDDDDFEKLIVVEFDLSLRKYITAINEEEVLADKKEAKYTDEVVSDTEDILGEGTASGDAEGTNEGANTNIVDESESENGNTEDVNAQTGENPDENINADEESDEEDIDDDNLIKYDREPRVNVSTLKSGDLDSIYKDPDEPTTALYKHTKAPVEVSVDDIVTYTLEVFNEGTVDGYASLIKDDIPEGVEFVQYEEGDGSVNDMYRWKMVDENDEEVTDPKDAKYIVSDYLSKDNETEENGNLIRAFDPETGTRLDSKYVKVQFRVICKQDYPKLITNYAQISDDSDDDGKGVKDRDSTTNEWIDGEDDQDIEHIWVTYMDLALRKFITGVTDFKTGKTEEITYRIPQVDPTALIDETGTTAKYEHTKEPVLVHTNDVVIYTLRIYNEGSKDGYATQIKDDLPEGLEFLPDHEINKYYEWSLVDKKDKPVTRLEDAEYAVTNYLSKDNETEERQNLIKSFDYYDYENDEPAKRETPEYKDIKIAFKVTEPQTSDRILINEAQISEQTDSKGIHREDRDSTPNEWLGEDDEDIEKVRVLYFDLALRKWVTKAIVTQNGEEKVFETGHHAEDDPEDVVKVDLKKSKINKVVVKFEYQIRITNEGEIDGYAKEIKDRIPEGLRFDPADNPTWTQLEENIIVTDQLKDTLLKPGESAEVTVVLTWINSGDNLGLKVNVAEISKDYNDYGTHDIDSTPDNNVWGEDDIDDAPVMLAVKTGNAIFGYIALAVFVGAIIVIGVRRIKKINEG